MQPWALAMMGSPEIAIVNSSLRIFKFPLLPIMSRIGVHISLPRDVPVLYHQNTAARQKLQFSDGGAGYGHILDASDINFRLSDAPILGMNSIPVSVSIRSIEAMYDFKS